MDKAKFKIKSNNDGTYNLENVGNYTMKDTTQVNKWFQNVKFNIILDENIQNITSEHLLDK